MESLGATVCDVASGCVGGRTQRCGWCTITKIAFKRYVRVFLESAWYAIDRVGLRKRTLGGRCVTWYTGLAAEVYSSTSVIGFSQW